MDALDKIDEALGIIESELEVYGELVEAKAHAEAEYKAKRAREWFLSKENADVKTVGDREAFVADKLETEYLAYILADAKLDAHKQRLLCLRSMLSGLQTLASAGRV